METLTSLREIQEAIRTGATSCTQVVTSCLDNIQKHQHLNAFLQVYKEEALAQAQQIDVKIAQGQAGRLAGMVVGLKDVLCYQDHPLQASSHILEGFQSQFSGTAVQKILDEDAIIIGRNNCDEFGMGSSNENSALGPVKNGIDPQRVPGGSSGGSAVAVQCGMCHAALGSDTGGSVRQPAAFTGVIGLKPTYSRISRHGLIAYASSFDTIGILTTNIYDNALLLEVIAGADQYDSTVSKTPVPHYYHQPGDSRTYRVGYIKDTLDNEILQDDVKHQTLERLEHLKQMGHQVEPVDFPLLDYVLPTYYILTTAEASSNLSRYDGVKYGSRSDHNGDLTSFYKQSRSSGFGKEVQKRIMLGTFVLSASYYDAYYTKAQKVRKLIKDKTRELFSEYDFIVLPTTPTTAFELGSFKDNPLEMYLADLFTVQASVSGIPAISIPNGNDQDGLPIGFQIMADDFNEQGLMAFAQNILNPSYN
ncbi:MAG: Asp-tRNA(Asn)/Glu-tRNA(Gln) amidotransferase subunit GatA [Cyclobacteriaceae bacterium]|nr:Asp-tRNA(Asn)/Glu-tRNA(Gln) amidotransferase subunit GatA [Cyclobacteriaceae bacterium]